MICSQSCHVPVLASATRKDPKVHELALVSGAGFSSEELLPVFGGFRVLEAELSYLRANPKIRI